MSDSRASESETVRDGLGLRLSRLIKAKLRVGFHGAKKGHPLGISQRRMDRIEARRHRKNLKDRSENLERGD
jgi:hypothetical protein